ncbi:Palmitoyltransferase PFA5 [Tolypocladium ophioglossoides CBS 100239]|uniref:Palmitoyltransferase n=1 Tax=Tolypocladium ophioglossoides (strain CBS 100239) TaxID=1163406 RepID=A0A0L0NED0_TOLOC|nr:Palmitoyltransferase PFA5 [Tolypocladium ophioglossoides CBS 100239]
MARQSDSNRAATRWTVRIIPFFIVGTFGVGTYAVVGRLLVEYLYQEERQTDLVAALLVLYFLFFLLTVSAYARTLLTTQLDPGLVPLIHDRGADEKQHRKDRAGRGRDAEANVWVPPDQNPDSPGLEAFYSKEVFVCEADGRPKWCSECRQWKPDRAHHSSELDRCVRKMDHLCPWVGGIVAETSFNFFFQFTLYTACLCFICIATAAYSLQMQNQQGRGLDGWVIVVIVLAAVFGFFTFAMTLTSARFIFTNITNIDMLRKTQVFFLAVRIPLNSPPSDKFPSIVYPLQPYQAWEAPGQGQTQPNGGAGGHGSARDQQAARRCAILRTEPRENPWDLGYWGNWKSVMGNNVVEWLLPIKHSPCCNHESMEGDYQFGPLVAELKKRYGIAEAVTDVRGEMEMHNTGISGT